MTDVNDWSKLVNIVKFRRRDIDGKFHDVDGKPLYVQYVHVPLNDYQIGNILGALARTQRNGDWWHEVMSVLLVAMEEAGIKVVANNYGDTFTIDDVRKFELKPCKQRCDHPNMERSFDGGSYCPDCGACG